MHELSCKGLAGASRGNASPRSLSRKSAEVHLGNREERPASRSAGPRARAFLDFYGNPQLGGTSRVRHVQRGLRSVANDPA